MTRPDGKADPPPDTTSPAEFLSVVLSPHLSASGPLRAAVATTVPAPTGGGDVVFPCHAWRPGEMLGAETHFSIALFEPDESGRVRATAAQWRATAVIVLDDVGAKAARPPVHPTWVMETSPGCEQWGFALRRPITDKRTADTLIRALADAGWTDPSSLNRMRWFRLPGSRPVNKTHAARLRRIVPHVRYDDAHALAAAFGLDLQAELDRTPDLRRGEGRPTGNEAFDGLSEPERVSLVREMLWALPEGAYADRADWLRITMAVATDCPEAADAWDQWCAERAGGDYDPDVNAAQWDNIVDRAREHARDGITIRTLLAEASAAGWTGNFPSGGTPGDMTAAVPPDFLNAAGAFDPLAAAPEEIDADLLDFDATLALEPSVMLIDGLLADQAVSAIYGPPGSYKTFFALSIALHLAAGRRKFFGRAVREGAPILYVALEGAGGLPHRLSGLMRQFRLSGDDVRGRWFTRIARVNLFADDRAADYLRRHVEVIERRTGERPMVVIDTLRKASAGMEENSVKDVGVVLDRIESLIVDGEMRARGVVYIHHTGKDIDRGQRGASNLEGDVGGIIKVTADRIPGDASGSRMMEAVVERLKEHETGALVRARGVGKDGYFVLEPVDQIEETVMDWEVRREADIQTHVMEVVEARHREALRTGDCTYLPSRSRNSARFISVALADHGLADYTRDEAATAVTAMISAGLIVERTVFDMARNKTPRLLMPGLPHPGDVPGGSPALDASDFV